MKGLLREQLAAAWLIRNVRKRGEKGKLALVLEEELLDNRAWLAKRDMENQLMQQCIFGMMEGRSPCEWCEDYRECSEKTPESAPHGCSEKTPESAPHGCRDWFLRFLTKEEEEACEQRAATKGFAKRAPMGRDDEGPAAGETVQKRDYAEGS